MKKAYTMMLAAALAVTSLGTTAAFAEEETSNELTVAVGSQFTTFDPALNTEIANNYVMTHMYSGLFRKDDTGVAVKELCDDYEVSEDGLTYTFKLVEDAVWSDGEPITAYDFEYSYLRVLSYGADNAWAANDMVSFIEGAAEYSERALEMGAEFDCTTEDHSSVGITAIDEHTLELKLINPCAYLPGLLSSNSWIPVREDFAPQHESLWAFEAGYPSSGPYVLTECNETEKAVIVKNENYMHADDITMDTINYLCMADQDAQALAYQTGEIDIALGISSETAMTYEGTDELWLMALPSNYFLAINSGEKGPEWAKDVNVRRALALALDKEIVTEIIGGSLFYPALNGYVPEGIAGIDGSFRSEGDADGYTLTYDPEQAIELLAEAGYDESNPLKITYKYSNNGIHGDVATMLQALWQAIGVEVEFACVESGVFYDQVDQGDFEICRYGYTAADSAIQFLELWTTSIQVVPAVDVPEFDQMIADARKLADPVEFNDALHAAEDYLVEENVYVIPLFNYNTPALAKEYVEGYTLSGTYPYFGNATIAE